MVMGRRKESWGGVTVVRRCANHQGGVKCIREVCQLLERYDGHGGLGRCDRCLGRCDRCQEV